MTSDLPAQGFNSFANSDSVMRVDEDGNKEWRNARGQRHRLDGPAIEWADGTKAWWVEGKRHRLDGPAYEGLNELKAWYVNNQRHRLDGPAIEFGDGSGSWWIDNQELSEEEFNQHPKTQAFQIQKRAAAEVARQRELDRMHKVLGAAVRDFHKKIRQP